MTDKDTLLLEKKNRALQFLQKGLFTEARALFQDVCNADKEDTGAKYMLAVTDTQLGNYSAAEGVMRQVLDRMPEMADAHFMLGQTLQGQQKLNDASKSFNKALSLRPDMVEAYYNLASVLHASGKHSAALENYNCALEIRPDHVDAISNQGAIFRELGNLDAAEERFRAALNLRPDLDYLRGVLGVTLVQLGKQDEGLEMLRKGLRIQSSRISALKLPDPEERIIDTKNNIADTTTSLPDITIATSLAPKNIENQRTALDSWRQLGFNVVSINSEEEIKLLQPSFQDIELITAKRHAGNTCDKPYIYFDDFLSYFDKSGARICGIINSDIHLKNKHLKTLISMEAPDSFLFGCRLDIGSLNAQEGKVFIDGFDYFFFDRKFIGVYPGDEFCLGLPWWDYWAVLVPILNQVPVKKLISPVAHHITHPINWDDDNWKRLGFKVAEYVGMQAQPTVQMLGYCARYIVFLIDKYSQKISLSSESNDG